MRLHASSLNYHDYRVMATPGAVADGCIPMSDGAGVVEAVGEGLTEFRVGGPGTLPQSIEAVRVGGHISLIGVLTGFGGEVPTAHLMRKQARLQGLIVGSRNEQKDYVRALEVTGIRPVIDVSFPLEKIAEAFRHEEAGKHFGKICLEW